MRIAVLTFHRAHNCGAMLQAWALKVVLERMGHSVEFPFWGYEWGVPRFSMSRVKLSFSVKFIKDVLRAIVIDALSLGLEDIVRYRYRRFIRKFLGERRCRVGDFRQYFDLVISGSDQVWNAKLAGQRAAAFLGESLPQGLRLISYAASAGDAELSEDACARIRKCLPRFAGLSVRENRLRNLLLHLTDRPVSLCADPVLLLEAADYDELAPRPYNKARPYLYVYTLSARKFIVETACAIAKRLGVDLIITPVYQTSLYRMPRGVRYGVSPEQMISYVKGAKYVLAASFHGTAVSIIFGKQFLSLRTEVDVRESRPASLLNDLGMPERIVNPSVTIDDMITRLTRPLSAGVDMRLKKMRECSTAYLKTFV